MSLPLFSLIIPTHGKLELVQKCIATFRKYETDPRYEIIVVDDGSPERDAHFLQQYSREAGFKLVVNAGNRGFAHAVNRGIDETAGRYLLLCNNDIEFTGNVLEKFWNAFSLHSDTGVVGARLFYPDGRLQHGGIHYNATNKSFVHTYSGAEQSKYCIAVTGALMMIDRVLLRTVGLLNEQYFLACEDTEYCLRAWHKGYRVYYEASITAIHAEGATRGNTPQKKRHANPQWMQKEAQAIRTFQSTLKDYRIGKLLKLVEEANTPMKKIEVGSGYNPHPGYLHLDIRKGLPQLDYVCDFAKQKLPFKNEEVDEILANHVIEHISFRRLPHVVSEWARVLKRGGKLVLRTPDLKFICEKYLKNETTPEWPGDEQYIKDHLSGRVTPAWWANIKLFSGQDYEANFHHVCFDFPMLRELLEKYGFGTVERIKLEKEFSPGELQVQAFKGERPTALLVRKGALGDVLLTTPIAKRLSSKYDVYVATDFPEAFEGQPWVKNAVAFAARTTRQYTQVFDLDLAYERDPKCHIIDAYSKAVFGDTETEKKIYLVLGDLERKAAADFCGRLSNFIAIHPTRSWENRTWPVESWAELLEALHEPVVVVGGKGDLELPNLPHGSIDLRGKLLWRSTAGVIEKARAFIGMDSALLHIAQAVNTPAFGLFTCAKAEYRGTSNLLTEFTPDINCYGCLHDEKPPVTYCGCRRGDFKCLELFNPAQIASAVQRYYV